MDTIYSLKDIFKEQHLYEYNFKKFLYQFEGIYSVLIFNYITNSIFICLKDKSYIELNKYIDSKLNNHQVLNNIISSKYFNNEYQQINKQMKLIKELTIQLKKEMNLKSKMIENNLNQLLNESFSTFKFEKNNIPKEFFIFKISYSFPLKNINLSVLDDVESFLYFDKKFISFKISKIIFNKPLYQNDYKNIFFKKSSQIIFKDTKNIVDFNSEFMENMVRVKLSDINFKEYFFHSIEDIEFLSEKFNLSLELNAF